MNIYERNQKAREACLRHYGYKCFICRFDFKIFYGEIGREIIHVHHKNKMYTIDEMIEIINMNEPILKSV
jgi:5-methylcytosine-specific restriction protein A